MENDFSDFVNCIADMDSVLYENNIDIDVNLYETIDISSVQIQNDLLYGGILPADIIHMM